MKGAPWFKFWVADFRGGTLEFSNQEIGAFLRLLLAQWEQGSLPSEPESLAMLACGPVSARVLAKFKAGADGRLRSTRMEKEREGATMRSEMGKEGAKARWGADRKEQALPKPSVPHAVGIADGNADRNAENRGQRTEDRIQIPEVRHTQSPETGVPAPVRASRKPKRTEQDEKDVAALYSIIPKKEAREAAVNAYAKMKSKPPIEELTRILRHQVSKKGDEWTKEHARYCIRLSVWIKERRWEDGGALELPMSIEEAKAAAERYNRGEL